MEWWEEADLNPGWAPKKPSVTTDNDWLIKAVEQKNPHLTVGVAYSELLVIDQLDRQLFKAINHN